MMFLYLARKDVLTARDEHVVGAANEKIEAIGVAAHHVIGVVPAVPNRAHRLLRQVEVAAHQRGRAHLQDAFARCEGRSPLRIDQA
jgi:hypothetical protein